MDARLQEDRKAAYGRVVGSVVSVLRDEPPQRLFSVERRRAFWQGVAVDYCSRSGQRGSSYCFDGPRFDSLPIGSNGALLLQDSD